MTLTATTSSSSPITMQTNNSPVFDESDMFGPPRSSPSRRSRVPMISPKMKSREERKRVFHISSRKLEKMSCIENDLRRCVCIHNTFARLSEEIRREKQNKYLSNIPKSDLENDENSCDFLNDNTVDKATSEALDELCANLPNEMLTISPTSLPTVPITTQSNVSLKRVPSTSNLSVSLDQSSGADEDLEMLNSVLSELTALPDGSVNDRLGGMEQSIDQLDGCKQMQHDCNGLTIASSSSSSSAHSRKRPASESLSNSISTCTVTSSSAYLNESRSAHLTPPLLNEYDDRMVREALSEIFSPPPKMLTAIDDCPLSALFDDAQQAQSDSSCTDGIPLAKRLKTDNPKRICVIPTCDCEYNSSTAQEESTGSDTNSNTSNSNENSSDSVDNNTSSVDFCDFNLDMDVHNHPEFEAILDALRGTSQSSTTNSNVPMIVESNYMNIISLES